MSPALIIPNPTRKTNWAVLLFALSCLTFIIAGLFFLDGQSRARRRQTELGWPTVEARTEHCSIVKDFRSPRRGYHTAYYYVHCRFSYSVDGNPYKSSFDTVALARDIFGRNADQFRQRDEWVRRHRPGQQQEIRYDPAAPSRVSLAGMDQEIEPDQAEQQYGASRVSALFGLGLLVAAGIVKRIRDAKPIDSAGVVAPGARVQP